MSDVTTDGNLVDLFADEPYPHYSRLRASAPAFEHPLGFWMLTRYDDVSAQRKAGHSADEPNLTTLPSWNSDSGTLGRRNRMMGGLPSWTRMRPATPGSAAC